MKTALIQFETGNYKIRGNDVNVAGLQFPLIEHYKEGKNGGCNSRRRGTSRLSRT